MRLFVTGGTGFLGGHFINAAHGAGHFVYALRRAGALPRVELNRPPQWCEGDLDGDHVAALCDSDVLVHFAAAGVSPQVATVSELFDVNVRRSLDLFQNAVRAGVRRLVICGSCFEYGASGASHTEIPASAPLLPQTAYGASKAAATFAAVAVAQEHKCRLQVLRPFNLYGVGQYRGNLWTSLRHAAQTGGDYPLSPGAQTRDFMPVEAAADAFLAAAGADFRPQIEFVNVGSGHPCTVAEFATEWWARFRATGRLLVGALPYRENEVMRLVPEIPSRHVLGTTR